MNVDNFAIGSNKFSNKLPTGLRGSITSDIKKMEFLYIYDR